MIAKSLRPIALILVAVVAPALAPGEAHAARMDPRVTGLFRGTVTTPEGSAYDIRVSNGFLFGRPHITLVVRDSAGKTVVMAEGDLEFDGSVLSMTYLSSTPADLPADRFTLSRLDMAGMEGTFSTGNRMVLGRVDTNTPHFWIGK